MAFIIKKKINGKEYYYLRESKRVVENGKEKVKAITLGYLGKTKKEAERKARELILKLTTENNKVNKPEKKEEIMVEEKKKDENKNCIIIHGSPDEEEKYLTPEERTYDKHWMPWIKKTLEQQGWKVEAPLMPNPWENVYEDYKEEFKKYRVNEDSILIGHSSGCAFLVRWLGESKQKVKKLVLIAPWKIHNENNKFKKQFYNFKVDPSIKGRVQEIIMFTSDNEEEDGKTSLKIFHDALGGKVIELKSHGHFTLGDMKTKEFPELLAEIIGKKEGKSEDMDNRYEKLMELANKKSLFYPAAEIYPNSPAGFWDFGPVGQSIRRKVVEFWRKEFVQKENMLEVHGSQILPASVFEGSGHLKSFADPIVQCLKCKKFERADKIISEKIGKNVPESLAIEKLDEMIKGNNIRCNKCSGELGKVSKFNMMVESIVGKQGEFKTFLRPEACQTIFLNFARMVKTMRLKLPQGIAQVGGAFRNEISPRQSITRSVEFSQMEAEIYFDAEKINEIENFDLVKDYKIRVLRLGREEIEEITAEDIVKKSIVPGKLIAYFMVRTQQVWNKMGIPLEKIRFREVDKDERAFYSLATFDFEVETSLGWLELIANNYRTDYDLKGHMEHSGTNLEYTDPQTNKKIIAHIWEVSAGVDRTMFAILDNCLKQGKEGLYLALPIKLAPFQVAIFPLVNKDGIAEIAKDINNNLKNEWFDVFYDACGSIGRRYARADEIGISFDITIDYDSLKNKDATLRRRDDGEQVRVKINEIKEVIRKLINGEIEFEKAGKRVNTRVKEE